MKRFFMLIGAVIILAAVTIGVAMAFGATHNVELFAMIGGMIAVVVVFFASRR